MDEAVQIEVLGEFAADPTISIRNVSNQTGISIESIHKVTKPHKFHPYKLQIVLELGTDDRDRRMQFYKIMTEFISRTPNLVKNICFSDECTFLNGYVNKQNCRYWSDENLHVFKEGHTLHPKNKCVGRNFRRRQTKIYKTAPLNFKIFKIA